MGIALCKSGLKNHFARHAHKKESDGFGASAQQAHTIARATQKTTTKTHRTGKKYIYIHTVYRYTEKQKRKKCKTRVVSTHGARTVCKYVFV